MANIFAEYNQKDATFHNLFISVRRSTDVGIWNGLGWPRIGTGGGVR